MPGARRLKFRRHLALVGLLLLLIQLQASLWPASKSSLVKATTTTTTTTDGFNRQRLKLGHDEDDDDDDDSDRHEMSWASGLLDYVGAQLPTLNFNYSIGSFAPDRLAHSPMGQLDSEVEQYYEHQFPAEMTNGQLQELSIKASFRTAPIRLHTSWGYQSKAELENSAGPAGNETKCKLQLNELNSRFELILGKNSSSYSSNEMAQLMYDSTDLEFMQLMDTFGRVRADSLRGNTKWFGSYNSCLKMRLTNVATNKVGRTKRIRFRYCLAAFKSRRWMGEDSYNRTAIERDKDDDEKQSIKANSFFIRIGVCLPKACDSRAYQVRENRIIIERLIKSNLAKPFDGDRYYLADLYCLPDDSSQNRQIPKMGILLLLGSAIWLAAIGIATIIHLNVDQFYIETANKIRLSKDEKLINLRPIKKYNWIWLNVYLMDRSSQLIGCLSLYSNWLKLTNPLKLAMVESHREEKNQAQLIELLNHKRRFNLESDEEKKEYNEQLRKQQVSSSSSSSKRERRVNTSSLNALKVISLVWIIGGHCLFYLGSAVSNNANFSDYIRDLSVFALANGAMYITELFFIITGTLTAYLSFNYNTTIKLEATNSRHRQLELNERLFKPTFWAHILAGRYLRILPTYLLVHSFVKLVSLNKLGSGPMWDYAMSENSIRRSCRNGSWLPVLTLTSNFVDIFGQCIVGGWYLSADVQFLLAAIPLLLLLANSKLTLQSKPATNKAKQHQQPSSSSSSETTKNSSHEQQQQQLEMMQRRQQQPQEETTTTTTTTARAGAWNCVQVEKRRIVRAYGIILMLAGLSALLSILWTLEQSRVDFSYLLKFVPHMMAILSDNISIYTNPVFRFRAFALGLLVGHLLYLYEQQLIELPEFIQRHGVGLSRLNISIGFLFMFMPVIYPLGKIQASHEWTIILTIVSATLLDIFLSLLILLLCIRKAPPVLLFLFESPIWNVPASLSLSAFLIHSELIVILSSQLSPPPDIQYSLMVFFLSATLILTYSLAFALYLCFELPFTRLMSLLLFAKPGNRMAIPQLERTNTNK